MARAGVDSMLWFYIYVACVAGASALRVVDDVKKTPELCIGPTCSIGRNATDDVMGERRVLVFGCSLDRNAIMQWCSSHNGVPADFSGGGCQNPRETAWCRNEELNVRLAYLFHPGVGLHGDLHKPNAKATAGESTSSILKHYANASAQIMLRAEPHMVVVDSSLWDLLVWRLGSSMCIAGREPPPPKEVTEARVQQWADHDLKKLLSRVSSVFPNSRVVFRTAPTIDHTPRYEKFEKRDIDLLYKYISSSTTNGKLFGEYEIIDYHAIMERLIDHNVPDLFKEDGYHPSWYPSELYVNEILRRVGLNVQDPPEPKLQNQRRAVGSDDSDLIDEEMELRPRQRM